MIKSPSGRLLDVSRKLGSVHVSGRSNNTTGSKVEKRKLDKLESVLADYDAGSSFHESHEVRLTTAKSDSSREAINKVVALLQEPVSSIGCATCAMKRFSTPTGVCVGISSMPRVREKDVEKRIRVLGPLEIVSKRRSHQAAESELNLWEQAVVYSAQCEDPTVAATTRDPHTNANLAALGERSMDDIILKKIESMSFPSVLLSASQAICSLFAG